MSKLDKQATLALIRNLDIRKRLTTYYQSHVYQQEAGNSLHPERRKGVNK